MRRYINNFKTESEYNQSAFSLDYPNINYIQNTDKVIWSRTRPRYKFLYEDTSGNSGGTAWDSANTQISDSDFINLGVDTSNIINLVVDSGVTAIGNYAFGSYNSGMTYNTMPNVTSIGTSAFIADGGYIDITKFPNLTTLGDYAVRLNDFDSLPSGITTIGRNSLNISSSNYQLKYAESGITIPSGITTTNGRLGADDTFISRVIFESSTPPSDSSQYKQYGAINIYVPNGSKSTYEAAGFGTSNRLYEMSGMQSGYSVTIEDESGNEIVKVPRMHNFEWGLGAFNFLGTDYLSNLFGTTHFHRINIYNAQYFSPNKYNFYNTSYDELYIGSDVKYACIYNDNYPYYTFRAKKIIYASPNYSGATINLTSNRSNLSYGYIEEIEFEDGVWGIAWLDRISSLPALRRIYFPPSFVNSFNPYQQSSRILIYDLPSLNELTIPSGVTEIQFSNLTSITSITLEANTVIEDSWNFNNTNNCPIYVPASIVNDYVEHYSGSVDTSRFIGYIDRNGSGTTCENGDLYATSTVERSYDGGQTWVVLSSTKGALIESASTECANCLLNFCGTDSLGNPISIDNGSTYLSRNDIIAAGASDIVEGAVGIKTETIGSYCFQDAYSLTSLTMDYTVTTIENEAFMDNTGLTTLTIPASVTSIGFWAFTRLYGLNEVIFEGTTPPTFINTMNGVFHDFCPPVIYVPDSAVSAYRAIDGNVWTNQPWDSNIIQPISNRH